MNKIKSFKSAAVFLFAPLFAFGVTIAAHAGTITVSNFSTPSRTAGVLNAAEKEVLTDHSGTISAVCGNHKIGIPPMFTFAQDNNFLVQSCAKGLVVKVTNAGYKGVKYSAAFKMKMIPAGAREPSTVTVSDFSAPFRAVAVVKNLQKVVFADGRIGTITASGDGLDVHVTNADAVIADKNATSVYKPMKGYVASITTNGFLAKNEQIMENRMGGTGSSK